MVTKVQKWGNSLGLRIPKSFAEQAGVKAGSEVDLSVEGGDLVIRPRRGGKADLRALLRGVSGQNLHAEIDTGDATGREAW